MVTTGSGAGLFVSNARPTGPQGMAQSGNCSVARVNISLPAGKLPTMTGTTVIADGISCMANKTAFVLAPTGLAFSPTGALFVAETPANRITAVPAALSRTKPVSGETGALFSGGALDAPLGMTLAPNGDLIVMNGGDGNAVEIHTRGQAGGYPGAHKERCR